jgi:hypothetical protein
MTPKPESTVGPAALAPKHKREVVRVQYDTEARCWRITTRPNARFTTKADAIKDAKGYIKTWSHLLGIGRTFQLVVHKKNGQFDYEHTYPRSSDPKEHRG